MMQPNVELTDLVVIGEESTLKNTLIREALKIGLKVVTYKTFFDAHEALKIADPHRTYVYFMDLPSDHMSHTKAMRLFGNQYATRNYN